MSKNGFGADQENSMHFITGVLTKSIISNSMGSSWKAQAGRSVGWSL